MSAYTKEEVDAMAERVSERVIVAVALPPQTGLPLSEFIYEGKKLDMKFIRENGPSEAYSNAEDYDDNADTTTSPDTQVNKP